MCGITGIYSFEKPAADYAEDLQRAVKTLSKRGPDKQAWFMDRQVGLGHARLSILDTSDAGSQPMTDHTGRYTIVFNGEIYNFWQLKELLRDKTIPFRSTSDTEVLLYLYAQEGAAMLKLLDGFFAFAIYDSVEQTLFVARDRMGIKPLVLYHDGEKVIFASEMKAILAYPIKKELDHTSLYTYLQLNYIPSPATIFKQVRKLTPGHALTIKRDGDIQVEEFYKIPRTYEENPSTLTFDAAKTQLANLLEKGVKDRLIADVPLGAFLSGGIDSSVIVALASRHTQHLNTFSIGYKDEPFFDETRYAELVAKKFDTNHTTFSLSNNDLYEHLHDILDYIDEPFADSSAIAVYILCKHTRGKVTVALSGDGADEMFAGYNKHLAEYKARQNNVVNSLLKASRPILGSLQGSRQSKIGNLMRQAGRYAEGLGMSEQERYWRWCAFIGEQEGLAMLAATEAGKVDLATYNERKHTLLSSIKPGGDYNDVLYADMIQVLRNDMLTKVDLMSMANSLEVRVPFLAHKFVDFAFSLPANYKLHNGQRKYILKEAFKEVLPDELFNRPKHGFEVPLLKWFRGELRGLIVDDLLEDGFIRQQGIFDPEAISKLKKQLFSANPGEVQARIWGLIVFQHWYKRYFAS